MVLPPRRFIRLAPDVGLEVFRQRLRSWICEQNRDNLPCSWAPLQSITAAASHRTPLRSRRSLAHARGRSLGTSSAYHAVWRCFWASEEASSRLPRVEPWSELRGTANGLTRPPVAGVERRTRRPRSPCSPGDPRVTRLHTSSQRTAALTSRSARAARASLACCRKRRRACRRATEVARRRHEALRYRIWPVTVAEAAARFQTGWSGGCLPNLLVVGRSQRRVGAEDAQRVVRRRLPWGSFPFRRHELGRSLRRFASPTPSVLRVLHPLDGLIPPGPRGSISPHCRP